MKKIYDFVFMFITILAVNAQIVPTIFRVNNDESIYLNDPNVFGHISDAINLAQDGDIIYIEPSSTNYGVVEVNKSLTFYGNGFLESNMPYIENQDNTSKVKEFILKTDSDGSRFVGIEITKGIFIEDQVSNDILIEKCFFSRFNTNTNNYSILATNSNFLNGKTINNYQIRKSFFKSGNDNYPYLDIYIFYSLFVNINNLIVENNIFEAAVWIGFDPLKTVNTLFRNNTSYSINIKDNNAYIANNIFFGCGAFAKGSIESGCTVKNNIFGVDTYNNIILTNDSNFPENGTNMINLCNNNPNGTINGIFYGFGGIDKKYELNNNQNNPAINAGVDIDGLKPDCGAFGGNDQYVLSGIPDIPTIYNFSFQNGNTVLPNSDVIMINVSSKNNK